MDFKKEKEEVQKNNPNETLCSYGNCIHFVDTSIINKTIMKSEEKMVCEGLPIGVASAINEQGGHGIKFAENGKCKIVKK